METLLTKIPAIDRLTRYYSNGDIADDIFLKTVIDNIDSIEENLNLLNCDFNDLECIYQYFWCYNFNKLMKDINRYNLKLEIINKLEDIVSKIDLNPKKIIEYINKEYSIVFNKGNYRDYKWHTILFDLIEFCYKYQSKAIKSDVFRYIEKNLYFFVLQNFELCKKYYKNNFNEFKNLFDPLYDSNVLEDFTYTDFLEKYINVEDNYIKEIAEYVCQRSLDALKSLNIHNNEAVYLTKLHFDRYNKIASKYKLPIANEYYTFSKTLNKELNEYIAQNGYTINGEEIDLTQLINELKRSPEIFKFVKLTHYLDKGEILNMCNNKNYKHDPLSEFFNDADLKKSDKYPYWKQALMNFKMAFFGVLLNVVNSDKKLSDNFYEYLLNICTLLEKQYFKNDINLVDEIVGIYEIIINIYLLTNNDTKSYILKALENSCALSLCAAIEKILRNVLITENFDMIYVDIDNITLGGIIQQLRENKSISLDILDYLEYFLLKENNTKILKNERPGKNIRNIQMHNHDDKYVQTDINIILTLLYLLMLILNELSFKKSIIKFI